MLRIGVVGAGKMGRFHLAKLRGSEEVLPSGVFDVIPSVAQAAAREFDTVAFDTLDTLLFESDAVIVACSTGFHYPIALKAIENGLPVLLEKPATGNSQLAARLCSEAEKRQLVLRVGFLERVRLNAIPPQLFPERISRLQAQRLSIAGARDQSVDIFADLMIHDLDLMANQIADEPIKVEAYHWPQTQMHTARLEFPSHVTAEVSCTYAASELSRVLVLQGEDRNLFVDFQRGRYFELNSQIEGALPPDALALQLSQFVAEIKSGTAGAGHRQLRALRWSERIRDVLAPASESTAVLPPHIPNSVGEVQGFLL